MDAEKDVERLNNMFTAVSSILLTRKSKGNKTVIYNT